MNFHEGDAVMHWTYGLGQIVRLEERDLSGLKTLYYAVQIRDLTVWVPADNKLESRLRAPVSISGFKKLLSTFSNPGEVLPEDKQERRARLLELLRAGDTASLCQIIRSLSAQGKVRTLNESDQNILKQAQSAVVGEWGFVLSVTPAQAEFELHRLLASEPVSST